MKNCVKRIVPVFLVFCLLFSVVACSSPKSLAKQYYKLEQQIENTESESKLISLMGKLEKLEEKYEKLSEADQEIFDAEYDRLEGE